MKMWLIILMCSCSTVFSQNTPGDPIRVKYSPFLNLSIDYLQGIRAEEVLGDPLLSPYSIDDFVSSKDSLPNVFASVPGTYWHHVLMNLSKSYPELRNGARMAIMHLAIYDAMVHLNLWSRTEDSIHISRREKSFVKELFLMERIAASAAAIEVLNYYFPPKREYLESLRNTTHYQLHLISPEYQDQYIIASLIGRRVGKFYTDYARTDRTNDVWEGTAPSIPGFWQGIPAPSDPMKGKWKALVMERNSQFRPGPPGCFEKDMEELRMFNSQFGQSKIAEKWMKEPVWDELLDSLISISGSDLSNLDAAWAMAVFHVGRYEATIASWDAKYTYWGIRPFQYDPDFVPLLGNTPNFPGYPAGHTAVAGALSFILSGIFPELKDFFTDLAMECSEARFEGGVHFRVDNEVGLDMGRKVGNLVFNRFLELVEK